MPTNMTAVTACASLRRQALCQLVIRYRYGLVFARLRLLVHALYVGSCVIMEILLPKRILYAEPGGTSASRGDAPETCIRMLVSTLRKIYSCVDKS